jgi:hypothetical protein
MGRQKNTEKSSAWARLLHAHTDEELTADLDAIIDHPFVIQRKDDADGPDLLWTLKQRCHDADGLKRIMSSALASPATPPDLYRMIVDFLGTHMALPEMIPKTEAQAEWQRVYNDPDDYALITFRNSMRQMLDLGWPPAHIAAQPHSMRHSSRAESVTYRELPYD